MEGKGSFFNIVLLFILAFLSLTLAALAGYVFVHNGASKVTPTSVVQSADTKVPSDDELTELHIIEDKTTLSLKITDPNTAVIPYIQVQVTLKYLLKISSKASSVKDTAAKVLTYKSEILQLISSYFSSMTREEAAKADKEKANKDLTDQINKLLNANEEKKAKIVYAVIFDYWLPV